MLNSQDEIYIQGRGMPATKQESFTLTSDQERALNDIFRFLKSKRKEYCLAGFAGTGKTSIAEKIIRLYEEKFPDNRAVVAATTNKAAKIISDRTGMKGMTIHRLLGIRMEPDNEGNYKQAHYPGSNKIQEFDLVIVDEASMICPVIFALIQKSQSEHKFKVLYLGDSAQLPPVKFDSSPVFDLGGEKLTEIVRQKVDSPILDLATILRDNLDTNTKSVSALFPINGSESLIYQDDYKKFADAAVNLYKMPDYHKNSDFCKILAYTNKTVAAINADVREALFGSHVDEFLKDEWIVTGEAVGNYVANNKIVEIPVSQDMKILSAKKVKPTSKDKYTIWELEVEYFDLYTSTMKKRIVQTVAADSKNVYNADLSSIATAAKKDKAKWRVFYELKERYAKIDYSYALTIHKSQGSTFQNVFFFEADIEKCRGISMQNRLRYVACSRAAEKLIVFPQ